MFASVAKRAALCVVPMVAAGSYKARGNRKYEPIWVSHCEEVSDPANKSSSPPVIFTADAMIELEIIKLRGKIELIEARTDYLDRKELIERVNELERQISAKQLVRRELKSRLKLFVALTGCYFISLFRRTTAEVYTAVRRDKVVVRRFVC